MSSELPQHAALPGLSADDVRRVAKLARLRVPDERVPGYRDELARVLGHIESLRSLDLDGVEPMSSPNDQTDRTAPDEPEHAAERLTNDQLRAIAPEMDGPYIKVPKVLSEGGSA